MSHRKHWKEKANWIRQNKLLYIRRIAYTENLIVIYWLYLITTFLCLVILFFFWTTTIVCYQPILNHFYIHKASFGPQRCHYDWPELTPVDTLPVLGKVLKFVLRVENEVKIGTWVVLFLTNQWNFITRVEYWDENGYSSITLPNTVNYSSDITMRMSTWVRLDDFGYEYRNVEWLGLWPVTHPEHISDLVYQ